MKLPRDQFEKLALEQLDVKRLADRDLVLLAAALDDCVHDC